MSNERKFLKSKSAKIILALAALVVAVAGFELFASVYSSKTDTNSELSPIKLAQNIPSEHRIGGSKLRLAAWEASFTERGLPVPESGPRDGVKGEKITKKNCGATLNCTKELSIPDIIEVDENGFQYAGNKVSPSPKILIVGGSVAWGAGASDIESTYFSRLEEKLKENYPDIGITVLATYASTSHTDLHSFVSKGLDANPDIVIFLNGLNDITTKQNPGSKDVDEFILNMDIAQMTAGREGIKTVFVRQPFPNGKINKTELEDRILELSNPNNERNTTNLYRYIGQGYEKLAKSDDVYYIDTAGCFEKEEETTFTDQ